MADFLNFVMQLDQQHCNSMAIWHVLLRHILRHETWIQFYMKYSLSQTFFELDDIIETTAAHFKKVRWLC